MCSIHACTIQASYFRARISWNTEGSNKRRNIIHVRPRFNCFPVTTSRHFAWLPSTCPTLPVQFHTWWVGYLTEKFTASLIYVVPLLDLIIAVGPWCCVFLSWGIIVCDLIWFWDREGLEFKLWLRLLIPIGSLFIKTGWLEKKEPMAYC